MNNPLREWAQRQLEARCFLRLGGSAEGAFALEVGCGRGVGAEIILDVFRVKRVDAFDFDPEMIKLAQSRLAPRGDRVHLWTGDAASISARNATYDAVFDFGIIHHVPQWPAAVSEIYRVLKPGGRLYAEEMLERFIVHPLVRRLLDHPLENRFDAAALTGVLEAQGFRVLGMRSIGSVFVSLVAEKPVAALDA